MNKIWVATYVTESTDRGVVGWWNRKPTNKELEKYFRELMPAEFEDGNRYVYWDLTELEMI